MQLSMREFKAELKAGKIHNIYVFHGEEGYLREYYLTQLEKLVVGDMMPEFNVTVITEKLDINQLLEACESYPVMSEKKIVCVRDFDIFGAGADFLKGAEALFDDMPEHCVLVFVYANIEYKPDKRKKICKAIEKTGFEVRFDRASRSDLISWVKRRFLANGKDIDSDLADYLLFYSGEIMQTLIPEIEKISAYAKKKSITRADIEAVASRNITSAVFDAASAVADRKYAKALAVLDDLETRNENAISVLALIAQQFKRLYAAKLIMERGGGEREVMELFDMRSSYPARCAISSARAMQKGELKRAMLLACEADAKLKRGAGWEELRFLIARLSEGKIR